MAHAMCCFGQLHCTSITNVSDKQERPFTETGLLNCEDRECINLLAV